MPELKLFMILLGCTPPGRHVEQHDFFFGIAPTLKDLIPEIKAFWPEADGKIHLDGWREVNTVEKYQVRISLKSGHILPADEIQPRLFFINLGGYQENKFEEQHYTILTVKRDKAAAFKEAKETLFYQTNHFNDAKSHIDDKYGIDVDDLYEIEDLLTPSQKDTYHIELILADGLENDRINLGYFKLNNL